MLFIAKDQLSSIFWLSNHLFFSRSADPTARTDNNVVVGTCSLNDTLASVLYDTGADYSFVLSKLSKQLGMVPTLLDTPYSIEWADGKPVEVNNIHRDCKLELEGQLFTINLLPITLCSFDLVVGMDWLSKQHAEILCQEKIIRIPLPSGEFLSIQGDRGGAMVGIISYLKA